MEDLRHVMQIIDQNAHNFPEGDYLNLCNIMRKLYTDKRTENFQTIVDYENFYNESLMNEEYFIRCQLEHINRELLLNGPIKRVTKALKERAITQYCILHGIQLENYDEETLRKRMDENGFDIGEAGTTFDKGVRKLYKSYIAFENAYRETYRQGLDRKIIELNACLDKIDEM